MSKTIVLARKAVVNFRKVMKNVPDGEVQELLDSNDLRESQLDGGDLIDIEWIHDDVEIEVRR